MTVLLRIGIVRRFWHFLERLVPFLRVALSEDGLGSRDGRTLIFGKARRLAISVVPPLARALQKHYGIKGGCNNCGTSCQLLFTCPHWESETRLCSVYEDRPNICRLFPITPADLRDRDIAAARTGKRSCGFSFAPQQQRNPDLVPAPVLKTTGPSFTRD